VSAPAPAAQVAQPPAATSTPAAAPKEIALKKPAARPESSSTLATAKPVATDLSTVDPEPVIHHSGVSFLHIMVIIGLLVLSIIMQVISKKTAQKNYVDLANRITHLESKIPALVK